MSFSGLRYLTVQGMHNLTRNKLMSMASVGILAACLVITGVAALLSLNVNNFVDYLGAQNRVIVYLQLDADDALIGETARAIDKVDNLLDCTFVSKEEALEETKGWIAGYDNGAYANVLDGYAGENNPLYASFRVTVDDLSQMGQTVARLQQLPGVDFVDAPSDLARTLVTLKNTVAAAGWGLVAVLALISLVVISNTIRVTVYARRKEINIMKFVGATNSFIRLPFLVEGALIGLLAALISFGLVTGAYLGVLEAVQQSGNGLLSSLYFSLIPYRQIWPWLAGGFGLSGVLIGAFGSGFSVRRHLKV